VKNRNEVVFVGTRPEDIYIIYLHDILISSNIKHLVATNEDSWIWHKKLGHASMDQLSKLIRFDLAKGLSMIKFEKDKVYDAFQQAKTN